MTQPQSGVSTEDGELLPTQWKLFNELHEFLKTRHGINPTYIIDQDVCNSAGPSRSSNSSASMSSNSMEDVMEVNSDSTDNDTDHFLPEKRIKKNSKQDSMMQILKETSEDVRKSVRNIEKLVEFATIQMFPDAQFPELE